MSPKKRAVIIKWTILVVIGLMTLRCSINHFTQKNSTLQPNPTVVVQHPKLIKIADYVSQTGTLVSFNSVDLVARVEGYLDKVEFTDGSFVKKGQGLFVIEPQSYLEKLKEAQASVVIQQASYDYAKAEYARQQKMYKQSATSLNNVEKWAARTIQLKAEIDKAKAQEAIAAINYSYTHVLAPFDGRIGRHLVDPGNLVGNGKATDLATLDQIDPIYVYFNLNELDLIKIRNASRHNKAFKPKQLREIPVYVNMQNEQGFPHQGKLDFVNISLNASTGTMEFRALLPNKDFVLLPGLFVQVRIPTDTPKPQLTLPDTAIQYDQLGAYVLLLDDHNVVALRRVTLGALTEGLRTVTKGLSVKDKTIVGGIQHATPGNQVTPIEAKSP